MSIRRVPCRSVAPSAHVAPLHRPGATVSAAVDGKRSAAALSSYAADSNAKAKDPLTGPDNGPALFSLHAAAMAGEARQERWRYRNAPSALWIRREDGRSPSRQRRSSRFKAATTVS